MNCIIKGEIDVWDEFIADPESLAYESEKIKAKWLKLTIEEINNIQQDETPKEGIERERYV